MKIELAIIGGTGVYDSKMLTELEQLEVTTRYGTAHLTKGTYKDTNVVFLARHGAGHSVPPHKINYRANIAALVKLGVPRVIATAAVGTLNENMPPGSMVLLEQFLDFTKARQASFFDGGESGVVHTDFTYPYCRHLNKILSQAAAKAGLELLEGGVYVCTEGPRFETAAEISMYKQLGGDLVGMTNVPEVVLAREAGLCYSTVALATNYAAGIAKYELSHQEVLDVMASNVEKVRLLLMAAIELLAAERECNCKELGSTILL